MLGPAARTIARDPRGSPSTHRTSRVPRLPSRSHSPRRGLRRSSGLPVGSPGASAATGNRPLRLRVSSVRVNRVGIASNGMRTARPFEGQHRGAKTQPDQALKASSRRPRLPLDCGADPPTEQPSNATRWGREMRPTRALGFRPVCASNAARGWGPRRESPRFLQSTRAVGTPARDASDRRRARPQRRGDRIARTRGAVAAGRAPGETVIRSQPGSAGSPLAGTAPGGGAHPSEARTSRDRGVRREASG